MKLKTTCNLFGHTYLISTVQVWSCREDLEVEGREGIDLQPHTAVRSITLHAEVLHTTYYPTLTCNLQYFPSIRCPTPYLLFSKCITPVYRIVPCFPAQCSNCGKKFTRKSSLVKHMTVAHGTNRPPNALRDKYLARVRGRRSVSCATCNIPFKTKSYFKEHMKKKQIGSQLLAPGPAGVDGRFMGKFMVVLDGSSMGDKDILPCKFCNFRFDSNKELVEHKNKKHQGEGVHPCSTSDMAFKSLPALYKHKSRQHSGTVFVCEGCGKTFKTSDSLNRRMKLVCSKPGYFCPGA